MAYLNTKTIQLLESIKDLSDHDKKVKLIVHLLEYIKTYKVDINKDPTDKLQKEIQILMKSIGSDIDTIITNFKEVIKQEQQIQFKLMDWDPVDYKYSWVNYINTQRLNKAIKDTTPDFGFNQVDSPLGITSLYITKEQIDIDAFKEYFKNTNYSTIKIPNDHRTYVVWRIPKSMYLISGDSKTLDTYVEEEYNKIISQLSTCVKVKITIDKYPRMMNPYVQSLVLDKLMKKVAYIKFTESTIVLAKMFSDISMLSDHYLKIRFLIKQLLNHFTDNKTIFALINKYCYNGLVPLMNYNNYNYKYWSFEADKYKKFLVRITNNNQSRNPYSLIDRFSTNKNEFDQTGKCDIDYDILDMFALSLNNTKAKFYFEIDYIRVKKVKKVNKEYETIVGTGIYDYNIMKPEDVPMLYGYTKVQLITNKNIKPYTIEKSEIANLESIIVCRGSGIESFFKEPKYKLKNYTLIPIVNKVDDCFGSPKMIYMLNTYLDDLPKVYLNKQITSYVLTSSGLVKIPI